jgi:hypothetical protein
MKKLIVIATMCAMSAVWADDDKAKPAGKKKPANPMAMQAPKPGPEAKELLGLVGTWKSNDTMEKVESMMMPGGEGTSTETYTRGPGGFSVVLHVTGVTGPMAGFHGLGVLSYNPEEQLYKMAWVDSMGPGLTMEAGHKEGNDIVMTGEMSMGGKKYKTKDVMSDRTPTSFTLTSYSDDGTGEKKMMTIKLTKEETKPKTEAPK